jgi:signal transduction histidine kinase
MNTVLESPENIARIISKVLTALVALIVLASMISTSEGSAIGDDSIDLPTREGQHITQDISVTYNTSEDKAAQVFKSFRGSDMSEIEATFIRRTIITVAQNSAGQMSLSELISSKRDELQGAIQKSLSVELNKMGFALDKVNLIQLIAIEAMAIRRTATDVRTLLASKLAVISSQAAAADVKLTIMVDDDVPAVVRWDSEKVAWSVTTLVGNALRYIRAGSRRMSAGKIDVRVAFDSARSQVAIDGHDDGLGIPADTVARLFRRDGLNVQGAGLAILLMSDICAAHGGTVDVRSSTDPSDHGTTIRLTLPSVM